MFAARPPPPRWTATCAGTPSSSARDGVVHRGGYDPPALLAALAP